MEPTRHTAPLLGCGQLELQRTVAGASPPLLSPPLHSTAGSAVHTESLSGHSAALASLVLAPARSSGRTSSEWHADPVSPRQRSSIEADSLHAASGSTVGGGGHIGPASVRDVFLRWRRPPACVLVVYSLYSETARQTAIAVCAWLADEHDELQMFVERDLPHVHATVFAPDKHAHLIDLVVSLGGDGLILHLCATLFPHAVPPVIPFHLGSLGFLTPFPPEDFRGCINRVLHGVDNTVALRMRLKCTVHTSDDENRPRLTRTVLNEVVIDRGPAPFLSNLVCFCDDFPVTRIQADGVILATPTGSTAYSLSSNGSMVHPAVPSILLTPICPHSLSFRPVLFPDYVTLRIKVPWDARGSAWVSFDGRMRTELCRGESVRIRLSPWPLATLTFIDQTQDWFRSVSRCLRWNERPMQRSMAVEEEEEGAQWAPRSGRETGKAASAVDGSAVQAGGSEAETAAAAEAPADPLSEADGTSAEEAADHWRREPSTVAREPNAFRSPIDRCDL